jgi:hypothetical protein
MSFFNPRDLTAGVTFTALDITERKRAETELRRSHQTFLTVLDGIDATVYVADIHSHEILFMNKHMIDAFGGISAVGSATRLFVGKPHLAKIVRMIGCWMRTASPRVCVSGRQRTRSPENGTSTTTGPSGGWMGEW